MKIGFEIEIEDSVPLTISTPMVSSSPDGSLRNGIEYVSDPLPNPAFASHLYGYMYEILQGNYSERCGLHFHMDFNDKSISFIQNFLNKYLLIERTLFRLYPNLLRSNNNFCNLVTDSPDEIAVLREAVQQGHKDFSTYSKYTALNLKSLVTIGTLEFRALIAGATPEDFRKILNIFNSLYEGTIPENILSQVTTEDRVEAEAIIQLINTPLNDSSENDVGDFMEEHFSVEAITLTEEDIRNYLRRG